MRAFIPWNDAMRLSNELDSIAGEACCLVNSLIRGGFWVRVEGGFQVKAFRHGPSEEEIDQERARLEMMSLDADWPSDRKRFVNYHLARFIAGVKDEEKEAVRSRTPDGHGGSAG